MTTDGLMDDIEHGRKQAAQEAQGALYGKERMPAEYEAAIERMQSEITSLEAQREGLQRELRENHELVHQCLKLLAHLIKALT